MTWLRKYIYNWFNLGRKLSTTEGGSGRLLMLRLQDTSSKPFIMVVLILLTKFLFGIFITLLCVRIKTNIHYITENLTQLVFQLFELYELREYQKDIILKFVWVESRVCLFQHLLTFTKQNKNCLDQNRYILHYR